MTKTMTVAEFREHICKPLAYYPDDAKLFFGAGNLAFYRLKTRGYKADGETPELVQIEFNELYEVTLDPGEPA